MYQTCHCVVTCNRGLNNDLNTESSKVSIKGILTLSWMILLFFEDPVVGSLTSLECALDGFHKLSHMAEEVFGEDVFSSGRKKGKQNKNVSGKKMTLFYHNVSLQLSNVTSQDMSLNSLSDVFLFRACCSPLFIQQQLFSFPKTLYYWMSKKWSSASYFALILRPWFLDIKLQATVGLLHINHHSFTKT